MSKVIHLSKKFNHRWKTDPNFIEGFDYDSPKYANVPEDLKWMLPMHEQQNSSDVQAESKRIQYLGLNRAEAYFKSKKRERFKVVF